MVCNVFNELDNGKAIVYDGDLVGWICCDILEKHDFGDYIRAKVETSDGTKLYRFCKEINSVDEIVKDGCVYSYKNV